jgi:glycosyltransferase involved in cell wall biosynthesis
MMPRFSLIVATFGRTQELSVLLQTLAAQQLKDFELIIVDQNPDDRLAPLLKEWTSPTPDRSRQNEASPQMLHLRCQPGVSRARNLGLAQSTGEILAFPDDDCWYYPDTLKKVDSWFRQNLDYGILSLGCRDEKGLKSGNHWFQPECDLRWINIFRTSGTCCFFVCRPPKGIPLSFDESLGPGAGTDFGCGEDTDFLLTLLNEGVRGRFYSHYHVGHPRKEGFVDIPRAKKYGAGFGRVLAKHSNPLLLACLATFDFVRAGGYALQGNSERASRLWAHGKAMIRAYSSR